MEFVAAANEVEPDCVTF